MHAQTPSKKNDGNIAILASGLISHFLPLICFNMCSHLADMPITTSASLKTTKTKRHNKEVTSIKYKAHAKLCKSKSNIPCSIINNNSISIYTFSSYLLFIHQNKVNYVTFQMLKIKDHHLHLSMPSANQWFIPCHMSTHQCSNTYFYRSLGEIKKLYLVPVTRPYLFFVPTLNVCFYLITKN